MIDKLSLIVPTLNEKHYLSLLLYSIVKQDYKGKFEVIIVDGKSKDKTVREAKKFKKIIKNLCIISTTKGISHQRNIGVEHAKYDNLIFLDADMVLSRQFLSKITTKIIPNEQFVGIPLILPYHGSFIDYCYTLFSYSSKLILRFFHPVITGKCIITSKQNHKKIGGFNEKAVFAEDIDYGLRSIANGAKYHMYLDIHLFTSIRRRKEIGMLKLNLIQLKGYIDNIRKGAITNKQKYIYSFGKHKKN